MLLPVFILRSVGATLYQRAPGSELLAQDIIKQECHIVQQSDKLRLSFSLAKQTILNRPSGNLRSAYIEAKVAQDPRVTVFLMKQLRIGKMIWWQAHLN